MSQATSRCTVAGACPAATRAPGFEFEWTAAAVRWAADRWNRIHAVRELNRLGDRHLRDIGIVRGDIEAIVDEMISRRRGR
jgi:uncharacterized protein YjiS (DUF1127 family)